jgi:Alpha-(1,6)-fucosyltransferase N- and catalytic domains
MMNTTSSTKPGCRTWIHMFYLATAGFGVFLLTSDVVQRTILQRRLRFDPISTESKHASLLSNDYWCSESDLEPLPYSSCNANDIIYRIPLHGGMTNAIKMALLAVIRAFEENRCFFLDESQSHLNNFDKVHYYENGFYSRYFERIGLSNEDPLVLKAIAENRTVVLTWKEVWEPGRYRRMHDQLSSIPSLGYQNVPGHELKAIMLRRMWRPLPAVREAACKRMHDHVGHDPFLAINIRRGDKNTEATFQGYLSMEEYVSAADEVIREKFHNVPPVIFVASDDCTVLSELRSKRPAWKFVSECDTIQSSGFVLSEMQNWTPKDYDAHYGKFFTELFAMYKAKFWIGIASTNVTWFVYFMRGAKLENFWLLDKPKGESLKEALIW